MHYFCTICGVYICPSPGSGMPTEDLEWYQEIRAVRRENPHHTAHLTGVGYLNSLALVIAPQDPDQSYRTSGVILTSYVSFYDPEFCAWTFIFHAACWEILRERVSGCPADIGHLANLLFCMLHCTTWDKNNYIRPGHDFGGAADFQKPHSNPLRDMVNKGYSHLTVDPSRFISVDDILHYLGLTPVATKRHDETMAYRETSSLDIFSKLPVEIVHLILTWIPSDDIKHLRLASRSVAYRSRVNDLSQLFWQSRFSHDCEMGFALPVHIGSHQNWQSLYFAIKHALQTPQQFSRLQNRKRTWQIIDINASLLSLHLQGIHLHGIATSWADFSRSGLQEKPLGELPPAKIITTEFMARECEFLRVGSRDIFIRSLGILLEQQSVSAVGISTVVFNSRVYVSGLRVLTKASIICEYPLGYVTSNLESLLWISPEERFAGFELATCDNGIVGVRLILEASCRRYTSGWVGDIGKGEPNVAFGILCTGRETSAFTLAGNFDAFKLISLALVDIEHTDITYRTARASERSGLEELEPQPLWTPDYSQATCLIPKLNTLPYQTYNPILNINFGGLRGENLEKMTRIVAHMEDIRAAFVGFMFDFDGKASVLYGKQGRIEVSFVLNAAEGERVSEITYEQASTCIGIWSLHVQTNFGRSTTFIPDELHAGRPGEPIPQSLLAPSEQVYYNEVTYRKKTLKAPHGQIITGFTSILGVGSHVFQTLGLQCGIVSNYTGSIASDQHIDGEGTLSAAKMCSSVGSYLIGGISSGCKAYTYAPLDGVRRIRFSCGSAFRPRQSNEISGLWLDYFELRPSKIVGQWISELDTLNLDPDEMIVEVSIYISKLDFSFGEKFHLGRVVCVSILTSQMRLKTVQSAESLPVDKYIELRFRANRLERLAFFSWAFNATWDHPRVLSLPATSSMSVLLWDPGRYSSIFPWIAAEKVLWEEVGLEGKRNRVMAVAAYWNSNYGVNYVTGLEFTYKSGAIYTIGYVCGECSREAYFGDNERISRLEMTLGRYGILDITLYIEGPQDGHRTYLYTLVGGLPEISDTSPAVLQEYDLSIHKYREYTLNSDGSYKSVTPQDLPNKEVEGFWGFNMGNGRLILGVIYSESS